MKIAIDARTVGIGGGAKNYVLNLLRAIAKIDKANEYVIFYNSIQASRSNFTDVQNFSEIHIGLGNNKLLIPLWNQVLLPINLKKENIDLIHGTKNETPFILKCCKSVITIHDLTPFLFPTDFMLLDRIYWKTIIPRSLRKSDRIIAISEHTKKDIVNFFNIPADKIDVILHGLPEGYGVISDYNVLEKVKNRYSLTDNFILYVGTIRPRKNIETLVKAFYKLKKSKQIIHKLVITGKELLCGHELYKLIQLLKLENDVIFTGFVLDEDLPAIYNLAELFVYPSLYEGFGLPPLESMACGTPVITSNTSSLPEVVGDAGIIVDPYDIDDLAKVMYDVLTDD
ncbi:MAG TPA: glycosyltransferase family 1 protein, partial [archaeon]|nr:glycosyltransferase family 1 protein [archaeon]